MAGQRMAAGKTVLWTVIISLVQRCTERKKSPCKERYFSLVFLEAACTAFGNFQGLIYVAKPSKASLFGLPVYYFTWLHLLFW